MNLIKNLVIAAAATIICVTPAYADTDIVIADAPFVTETEAETIDNSMYTITNVNFRTAPTTSAEIIKVIVKGTKVTNLITDGAWNFVELDGITGYIYNNYLKTEKETIQPSITTIVTPENVSAQEYKELVSIICAEAEDEPFAGQCAVGIVVLNRVAHGEYSNNIHGVIYEKLGGYTQFTPTIDGNLNSKLKRYDQGTIPQVCFDAANYALQGNKTVDYNGITIDMTNILNFARKVKNAKFKIGHHQFR